MRYFDGTAVLHATDLTSDGFGVPWSQTRSWSNAPGYAAVALPNYGGQPLNYNGNGWVDTQLPFIETNNNYQTAIVILSGTNALFFDNNNGTWTPHFFTQDQLFGNPRDPHGELLLTDTAGDQIHFYGWFDVGQETPGSSRWGRFKSMTDANGDTTTVTGWTADGKPTEIIRSTPPGQSPAATESWLYRYVPSGVNQGLLANVTLRRLGADGTWTVVRQVDYTYYDTGEAHGNRNDLKTAIVRDAAGNALDTSYYRYYPDVVGFDGLQYVFSSDSFARLSAAVGDPFAASDAQVAPYADHYYAYDAQGRVTKEVAQGTSCSCADTAGQGTYTYSYFGNNNPTDYNIWQSRTIETLPDNSLTFVSRNIVYSNGYGETMLKVYESGTPGQTQQWDTFYEYDNAGRPILKANPSAVTGYDESKPDLLNNVGGHFQYLQDHQGEIELTDYYAATTATETTPGGATGYVQDTKLEQGQLGTPILQTSNQYYAHSGGKVDVQVVTPGGVSAISPADQFTYEAGQPPTVTGFNVSSDSQVGGDRVTIFGSGFTGATGVLFGGTYSSGGTPVSDTALIVNTPSHAPGVVDVQVVTPAGISAISPADQFTYVTPAPPVITGIAPAEGLTAGGGTVTIIGSGLRGVTAVSFGDAVEHLLGSGTGDSITIRTPSHDVGVVDVTVTTPGGTSAITPADQFSYVTDTGTPSPVPVVTGVVPASVYLGDESLSQAVIIVGTGFTGATNVSFGGTAAPNIYVDSANVIDGYIPPGMAGTVDVTVTTPGGTSATTPADQFTYLVPPQPTVTAVHPASGSAAGGGSVVITGTGFTYDSRVAFGSITAFASALSDTILIAGPPAEAAGTVDVTVTTAGGTSDVTAADQYTYVTPPAPVVTGLGPTSTATAGSQVTIIGTDLAGATQVLFGGTPAGHFRNISATAINATIPSLAPGTVDVTVTTPGGTSAISPADQFTYGTPLPPTTVPVVTGMSPASGSQAGGTQVTLIGAGFSGATEVDFGGTAVAVFGGSLGPDNSLTVTAPARTLDTVYPLATTTVYRNPDGTGAETTQYAYTWFPGTTRVQSRTVIKPVVSSAQNGPDVADTETTVYDIYGRPIWQQNGDGFLTYTAYDSGTGAVIKRITDVDTSRTDEFQDLPAGWTTPPGGGLNLVTTYEVDGLGRTTAMTDPNGNITYMVYDDPDHEVRTYPGWQASTKMPTGPTQVTRKDREHSPSYAETLTMSVPPNVTNGRPDGTEPISAVQTLSRSFTSPGGQVIETDQYFSLDGITYSTDPYLGSAGTSYYARTYEYDDQGRLTGTVLPTGTIQHTVYDGLGRVASTWIGTNDTPGNGDDEWTPENNTAPANMVEVSAMVYDNGGVGDGNLTQETDFPGGGAAPRVTQNFYDWRDRLVASKQGVQDNENDGTNRPIHYTTYDNLNETVLEQQYEGDGVSINTVDGVPQPPDPSLLRAQTAYAYDDQGRVYQQLVYDIDPSTGAVSSIALATNNYYDHRSNPIAQSAPGGLWTKEVYDGAGRLAVTYLSDGGGGTTWADAASVVNDIVLQQIETVHDADGNALERITRQRFHNVTGTGALGDPSTAPQARVSYTGSYYDAANRLMAMVDVGTNGGTAWVLPGTVPAPSDTAHVTSYTYNAAGWVQDTIDPRGLDTHMEYDALGRTTATIANYTGNTETNASDVATLYTYDGDNHVLTMTAVQPAGTPSQTTAYVYGITPASGSAIASNDLLAATLYPDPATGQPSTNQEESYTYNALGQASSMTDRNGTTHQYSYDVLGRRTSDTVTTLGAGVDGSVLRLDTAYDQQGNPFLYTSYADTGGTTIVNQVEDMYNGLRQLTAEYQSHAGPVVIGMTPEVQYTYNEMANGENNSRLTSMIYPNGRVIDYNYHPGLDDRISRLSALSDATGVLEAYTYLDLGTVVERDHPQTGINLTYISPTGATGDAGDQYTGLDRFGRVVEQLWLNTNTGTATDDFQYTYDPDGNVVTKKNLVNAAFSEQYGYDNLNRLASFTQGTQTESWSFDALGNWASVTTNGTAQVRTANAQNQYTSLSGGTTPSYDNNGNLTTDPTNGNGDVYDAWNRLVAVENSGTTLAAYTYDALGRRITETSTATLDLYFSKNWQVVEEQADGVMQTQYVWSPVYVDAMVDRDTSDGTRLYAQQDANWNMTAVVDVTGTVQERYIYDPYGQVSFLAPDWSSRASTSVNWIYLHQGGRLDPVSGLYNFRNRDYAPILGCWMQQDGLGYIDGMNEYQYEGSEPTNAIDPTGTTVDVRWNTATLWHRTTTMPERFRIFEPGLGANDTILGATEATIRSIIAGCSCDVSHNGEYHLTHVVVYFDIVVWINVSVSAEKQAWAEAAEYDHVTDYQNWAAKKGEPLVQGRADGLASNYYLKELPCEDAANLQLSNLFPASRVITYDPSGHDSKGRHTWGGPRQRPTVPVPPHGWI